MKLHSYFVYSFYNMSPSGAESLYGMYFYFDQETSFNGTSLPTGWYGIVWNGSTWTTTTFADVFLNDFLLKMSMLFVANFFLSSGFTMSRY